MMRRTKMLFVVLTLVLATAIYFGFAMVIASRMAPDYRLYSDMAFLNAVIREELQQYFERHGRYPGSLEVLRESILRQLHAEPRADKSEDLGSLSQFAYSTDGESYKVDWSIRQSGTVYTCTEYGSRGVLSKTEMYENGELRYSWGASQGQP